jgi:hypothetical protein
MTGSSAANQPQSQLTAITTTTALTMKHSIAAPGALGQIPGHPAGFRSVWPSGLRPDPEARGGA